MLTAAVFDRVKGNVNSHVHVGRLAGGRELAGWRRMEGPNALHAAHFLLTLVGDCRDTIRR